MKLVIAGALVVLLPVAGVAQNNAPAKPCVFDTVAHTDTLTLEFSLRAFRETDTRPDPILTRAFGDMIRTHFAPPQTIGQLFFPNSYFSHDGSRQYAATFGTLQFNADHDGTVTGIKWFVPGLDQGTDVALVQALNAAIAAGEVKQLAATQRWKMPNGVRVQFLARSDTTLRSPIVRLHVPMLRIEQDTIAFWLGRWGAIRNVSQTYVTAAPYNGGEIIVDENGNRIGGLDVSVASRRAPHQTIRFAPVLVGGCPVAYRSPPPTKLP